MNPTASRIKKARKKRGWSQIELAERARCTEKTISRIETGQRHSVDVLTRVAKALGIDGGALVEDSDTPSVRRRPVRRVHDGFVCMEMVFETDHQLTLVEVDRDPNDDAVYTAIANVCDAIDKLRPHKTRYLIPTRTIHDAARTIGESVRALEKRRWLLELKELEEETPGGPYDAVCFWCFHFRPADEDEIESEESAS